MGWIKLKIRYTLKFDKSFFYSATWREDDRQVIIDKLKESCLDAVRNSLRHLSQLRDEQLLEILEVSEGEDKQDFFESTKDFTKNKQDFFELIKWVKWKIVLEIVIKKKHVKDVLR